ncbi:MAG: 3-dehydroquinate synthase [Dongiaceae bacterium]
MVSGLDRLAVALGDRSYDILIGGGLLEAAGRHVGPLLGGDRRPVVVADSRVAALHLPRLAAGLAAEGIAHRPVILPPGEGTKDFAHLARLVDAVLEGGAERGTLLIALGGGVIGDLTGFAASILLRGLDFVQVPTTLLAQVDSSVGGKTGINTAQGKNLVGTFHQPRLVLADLGALDTLPRRELLAGYAEIVKYGLLGDAPFFDWLEAHGAALLAGDPDLRREAVRRSCAAKAAIVAADEREGGQRALLNLGHTFGHALEAELGYDDRLLHGEAVAIGMVMAFALSARLGHCTPEDAARVRRHLEAVGLPTRPPAFQGVAWEPGRLIHHMGRDKKVAAGRITFILASGIGRAFTSRTVPPDALAATLGQAIAA